MWAIGFIAVVVLFKNLEDRKLAGELAGHMFTAINLVGIFCTVSIILMLLVQYGGALLKNWRVWLLLACLLIITTSQFVIRPNMEALKSSRNQNQITEVEFQNQFQPYHKLSSTLYTVTCLMGLALLVSGLHGKKQS